MKSRKIKNRPSSRKALNEILPEYDFSRAEPNKYAARYGRRGKPGKSPAAALKG